MQSSHKISKRLVAAKERLNRLESIKTAPEKPGPPALTNEQVFNTTLSRTLGEALVPEEASFLLSDGKLAKMGDFREHADALDHVATLISEGSAREKLPPGEYDLGASFKPLTDYGVSRIYYGDNTLSINFMRKPTKAQLGTIRKLLEEDVQLVYDLQDKSGFEEGEVKHLHGEYGKRAYKRLLEDIKTLYPEEPGPPKLGGEEGSAKLDAITGKFLIDGIKMGVEKIGNVIGANLKYAKARWSPEGWQASYYNPVQPESNRPAYWHQPVLPDLVKGVTENALTAEQWLARIDKWEQKNKKTGQPQNMRIANEVKFSKLREMLEWEGESGYKLNPKPITKDRIYQHLEQEGVILKKYGLSTDRSFPLNAEMEARVTELEDTRIMLEGRELPASEASLKSVEGELVNVLRDAGVLDDVIRDVTVYRGNEAGSDFPHPNEPGISTREQVRRQSRLDLQSPGSKFDGEMAKTSSGSNWATDFFNYLDSAYSIKEGVRPPYRSIEYSNLNLPWNRIAPLLREWKDATQTHYTNQTLKDMTSAEMQQIYESTPSHRDYYRLGGYRDYAYGDIVVTVDPKSAGAFYRTDKHQGEAGLNQLGWAKYTDYTGAITRPETGAGERLIDGEVRAVTETQSTLHNRTKNQGILKDMTSAERDTLMQERSMLRDKRDTLREERHTLTSNRTAMIRDNKDALKALWIKEGPLDGSLSVFEEAHRQINERTGGMEAAKLRRFIREKLREGKLDMPLYAETRARSSRLDAEIAEITGKIATIKGKVSGVPDYPHRNLWVEDVMRATIADAIENNPNVKYVAIINEDWIGVVEKYEGGLSHDSSGMRDLYGKIHPKIMKKLAKEFNTKIIDLEVPVESPSYSPLPDTAPMKAIEITPEMRQKILTEGQTSQIDITDKEMINV